MSQLTKAIDFISNSSYQNEPIYGTVISVGDSAMVEVAPQVIIPCVIAAGCRAGDRVVLLKKGTSYILIGNITNH